MLAAGIEDFDLVVGIAHAHEQVTVPIDGQAMRGRHAGDNRLFACGQIELQDFIAARGDVHLVVGDIGDLPRIIDRQGLQDLAGIGVCDREGVDGVLLLAGAGMAA